MNNQYQNTISSAQPMMYYREYVNPARYSSNNDQRFAGGFIFPFLLGGVTGAALAPNFWRPGYGYNNGPAYYPYPPMPAPYPYPPRRWF